MKQVDSKVRVENVPDMHVGDHWDMLLKGAEILLKHRGEKTTLNELMAYSGDAFNLCFASNWQEAAYMCIPTDTLANVAEAYGYDYQWLLSPWAGEMRKLDTDARCQITEGVLERIWAEIDAGNPVLVGGCADKGCGPWSVVVGYDRDNLMMSHIGIGEAYRWTGIRGLNLELDPGDGKTGFWNGRVRGTVVLDFVGGWQNNPAFFLKDKGRKLSERNRAVSALRRALEIFRAGPHRITYWGGVTYYFGQEAYERWADALRLLDFPADIEKPRPREAYGWYDMDCIDSMVDCIIRGRPAAAEFCERAADLLPKAAPNLITASKLFRDTVEIADSTFAVFIPAFVGGDWDRAAFLSNKVKRDDGIVAIHKMLRNECAAIAEIEKALAA